MRDTATDASPLTRSDATISEKSMSGVVDYARGHGILAHDIAGSGVAASQFAARRRAFA